MFEASKALMRRLHDSRFATRYFVGDGVDVGAGPDALTQYAEQFPLMRSCRAWDIDDGDAQLLASMADESLDFVHSSHCLEHVRDPREALKNWLRVLKPGGHMVVIIPDEDLFEQGVFPSTYNYDHKWTFTMHKVKSWSNKSVNLLAMLTELADRAQIIKVEQLDATFRFNLHRFDQTMTPVGECAVEFILRKLTPDELARRGRLPAVDRVPHPTQTGAAATQPQAHPLPQPEPVEEIESLAAVDLRGQRWKFLTVALALPIGFHLYQYLAPGAGGPASAAAIGAQMAGCAAAGYAAWWLWATAKKTLIAMRMHS